MTSDSLDMMYAESDDVRVFHLPIEPCPASRPRWSKFGVYYSKNYTKFRQLSKKFADDWSHQEKLDGPVAVLIECVCTRPKSGRKLWPRGDVDNHAKGPMDSMTQSKLGSFWVDDDQVVWLTCTKRYCEPGEDPHVTVYFCPVSPADDTPIGINPDASS